MTREEAINLVIRVFDTLEGECNIEYDWREEHNARDMAIKALEEQDSILDILNKLKAEIEQEPYVSKMEILDIIDKYKEGE